MSRTHERVAELEALVQELQSRLEAKKAELEALKAKQAASRERAEPDPVSYDFDPEDDEFMFLDLGVQRSYMQFESRHLLDQLRTAIPPLYEPAFSPFHGYTLPQGAFRITLGNDRFVNHSDFGRDKEYAAFFNRVRVQNQHVNVNFFYGLSPDNTLAVKVPFKSTQVSGTGQAFGIHSMVLGMEGDAFGLGDVQVMLKHKWLDQADSSFNLATVVGVQLPTGEDDNRFNDSQVLIMNGAPMAVSAATGGPALNLFSDDLRLPNSLQPGTGSWGLNLGMMATRQLTWNGRRGAIHGGVLYRLLRDNAEGVRPGNELIFGVSYVRPPLKSDHLSLDFTFFGRQKQSERFPGLITHPMANAAGMPFMNPDGSLQMFTTPRPPFEHGTVLFVSPSIIVIPKSTLRLTISPLFRVREPSRGPSPAFRLMFGIQSIF